MNIAHVIPSLDPAHGGPTSVVCRLASAQAAQGHAVSIIARSEPAARPRIDEALTQVPGIDAVRIDYLDAPGRLLGGFHLDRPLMQLIERADIAHLHGMWNPLLLRAGRMSGAVGRPYALMPHGMLYPWSLAQKALKKKVAMLLGFRRMIEQARVLLALNADEEHAIRLLHPAPSIRIVPNGIFSEEVASLPDPGAFRRDYPRLGDRPFILFLSRLHPGKGLHLLADTFKIVAARESQVDLVVAGPDAGAQAPFEAKIRSASLSQRVHLVGPIYGEKKMAAFRDAACFCLPSEHETFSMAITEAMGAGRPVVISTSCHFPEVAEAGAGEVVPLNPSAFADALLRILRDPDRSSRMGQAGRALVESRFTWPQVARQSLAAYAEALQPAANNQQRTPER